MSIDTGSHHLGHHAMLRPVTASPARVVLLAGLLVLTLGTAALAQSPTPSPVATPLFAPDDLGATLPMRVGDLEQEQAWEGFSYRESREEEFWEDLLTLIGKDVDDVRATGAFFARPAGLDADDLPLAVHALRIDGFRAGAWAGYVADAMLSVIDLESQSDYESGWRVVDGRDVYAVVLTPEAIAETRAVDASMRVPDDAGMWFYPVGEVVYLIVMPFLWPEHAPTVADVLAALPPTES